LIRVKWVTSVDWVEPGLGGQLEPNFARLLAWHAQKIACAWPKEQHKMASFSRRLHANGPLRLPV
jgi:hypothetical protein